MMVASSRRSAALGWWTQWLLFAVFWWLVFNNRHRVLDHVIHERAEPSRQPSLANKLFATRQAHAVAGRRPRGSARPARAANGCATCPRACSTSRRRRPDRGGPVDSQVAGTLERDHAHAAATLARAPAPSSTSATAQPAGRDRPARHSAVRPGTAAARSRSSAREHDVEARIQAGERELAAARAAVPAGRSGAGGPGSCMTGTADRAAPSCSTARPRSAAGRTGIRPRRGRRDYALLAPMFGLGPAPTSACRIRTGRAPPADRPRARTPPARTQWPRPPPGDQRDRGRAGAPGGPGGSVRPPPVRAGRRPARAAVRPRDRTRDAATATASPTATPGPGRPRRADVTPSPAEALVGRGGASVDRSRLPRGARRRPVAGLLALAVLAAAAVDLSARRRSGRRRRRAPAGLAEIPGWLIPLYQQASATYGLGPDGWAWLAAVNRIETDFGRDTATSSAGAVGWMQFEPATWAAFGVDGDGDGRRDPSVAADAVPAAAAYLRALGAPADWQTAIRAYNGGPANAGSGRPSPTGRPPPAMPPPISPAPGSAAPTTPVRRARRPPPPARTARRPPAPTRSPTAAPADAPPPSRPRRRRRRPARAGGDRRPRSATGPTGRGRRLRRRPARRSGDDRRRQRADRTAVCLRRRARRTSGSPPATTARAASAGPSMAPASSAPPRTPSRSRASGDPGPACGSRSTPTRPHVRLPRRHPPRHEPAAGRRPPRSSARAGARPRARPPASSPATRPACEPMRRRAAAAVLALVWAAATGAGTTPRARRPAAGRGRRRRRRAVARRRPAAAGRAFVVAYVAFVYGRLGRRRTPRRQPLRSPPDRRPAPGAARPSSSPPPTRACAACARRRRRRRPGPAVVADGPATTR